MIGIVDTGAGRLVVQKGYPYEQTHETGYRGTDAGGAAHGAGIRRFKHVYLLFGQDHVTGLIH